MEIVSLTLAKQYAEEQDKKISLTPGATGPQGVQGVEGPVGPQGIQGPKGDKGDTPIIQAAAGSNINSVGTPSVSASTSGLTTTFTFNNLKGATGAKGDTPTVTAAAGANINAVGTPTVTASTSGLTTTFTFNNLKGATGAQGPKGDKGDKGDTGPQGPAGGNGTNGTTPTIKAAAGANIGTVGTPSVTASTSGTTTTFTFNNLKGAKGDKGDTGPQGPQGPAGTSGATASVVSTSANGLAPKVTNTSGYLKGDGTWGYPNYLMSGIPTGSVVGNSDIMVIPNVPYSIIDPTHETETYIKELIKWICQNYKTSSTIFIGSATPNSAGTIIVRIYDTRNVNADGYPQYAGGIYIQSSGKALYNFGINDYAWLGLSRLAYSDHAHSNYLTSITKKMVTDALGYTPPTTDTNSTSGSPAVTTQAWRNIYAGTSDMTAGSSALTTGTIYVVYE